MPALKRLALGLGVLCTLLFVGCGFLFWSCGWLHIQASFADEQTEIFDETRVRALQATSPPDIAGYLEYAVYYYPSGTKQRARTKLDRVVERYRTAVVRDIVAHLRHTTGQDLGESPEPWIQKYAKR
jgi:hypothetical protein